MNTIASRYLELTNIATGYARRMARLRNRIFGEPIRPVTLRTTKVVKLLSEKPVHLRPEIIPYYPRHVETHILMKKLRYYGLYRDEHEDFKEEMKRLRTLRGKGPTKKGEGKRASKK